MLTAKGQAETLSANKEVINKLFNVLNTGDFSPWNSLVSQDYIEHGSNRPSGRAGFRRTYTGFRYAFPDIHVDAEYAVAQGDLVFIYTAVHATQTGEFNGIAPTGRAFNIHSGDLYRLVNNQVAEHWDVIDQYSLLQQIGAVSGGTTNQAKGGVTPVAATPGSATLTATPTNLQSNKTVVETLVKAINDNKPADIKMLIAENYVEHAAESGVDFTDYAMALSTGFPDLHWTIKYSVAEGNMVYIFSSLAGTQSGRYKGVPPSGRKAVFDQVDLVRIENGKLVEHWGIQDRLSLFMQLGTN
jgi:predicted ester cyclase